MPRIKLVTDNKKLGYDKQLECVSGSADVLCEGHARLCAS